MARKRRRPHAVKAHRCFDIAELARRLAVHPNTIRLWQSKGLQPLPDCGRKLLFTSDAINAYLSKQKAGRKVKCPPGTIYCLKCRAARNPAGGLVQIAPINAVSGNLKANCNTCGKLMYRRAPIDRIATIMPGIDVQPTGREPDIIGNSLAPANCDDEVKEDSR